MVPSQGSVGASGDLAPLAHLALALIGEGECLDEKGIRISAADALRRAEIKPLVLEAKEAVSLINGTQAMLAVGIAGSAGGGNIGRFRGCDRRTDARRVARNRRGFR